jgi:serine/threonine-protein kinase
MVAPRFLCNRQQLQQLLDDALPNAQQQRIEAHLEQCETCRAQLEALAATADIWREATEVLTSESAQQESQHGDFPAKPFSSLLGLPAGAVETTCDPTSLGSIEGYDLLDVTGRGGMGIVARAHDRQLNRMVAIKFLAPHLATSAAARERFAREAQAAAAVVHPHVVPIHAVNGNRDIPYLVMQYVTGKSVQDRIDRAGPLPVKDILRIAMQTARGLAAAHEQGLIHRDVKPSNILLENGVERVMLGDFGLARAADDASLTRSGVIAGTPDYMSPEQAAGVPVDQRTDLFSLGSVMYAMATGHPPFRAERAMGVLHRICHDRPRPLREVQPDLPPWFESLVERLLQKDPDRRFASASETAEVLAQCLAHVQQPTHVPLPTSLQMAADLSPPTRSNGTVPIAVSLVTVFLLVAMAVIPIWRQPPNTGPTIQTTPDRPAIPGYLLEWDDRLDDEIAAIEQTLRNLERSAE